MQTPHLLMPLIVAAQAQKHVTHNEALALLDNIVQLSVLSAAQTAPPVSPSEGDRYIVPASPSGGWTGHGSDIAVYNGGIWVFIAPATGWLAFDQEQSVLLVFDQNGWQTAAPGEIESSPSFGVNTNADTNNRLSVKSDGVLFSHDDQTPGNGSMRLGIDRDESTDSAHVQFSTNYVTTAELGLAGDDLFRVKVSPDGSVFNSALNIAPATGNVAINTTPTSDKLAVREDMAGPTQFTVNNYSVDASASAAFRLNAANGHYLNFQLYGSGTIYAYSNARMIIGTYADEYIALRTDTTDRMFIHGDGRISIGTIVASAQLSVNGAVRHGQYTLATLPSASTNGAGAMIYVSDATGGAVMAFSDGTEWRRATDRSVVD